jgi:cation transporter-like permease
VVNHNDLDEHASAPRGSLLMALLGRFRRWGYARRLALARGAWLGLAGVIAAMVLLQIPINVRSVQVEWRFQGSYAAVAGVLSRPAYAAYFLAVQYAVAVVCMLAGAVIAWRKADDRAAWLAGALLVMVPVTFALGGYAESWSYYPPPWQTVLAGMREILATGLGASLTALFFFVFPNGKMPLRWMGWVFGLVTATTFVQVVLAVTGMAALNFDVWFAQQAGLLFIGLFGQVYRYRRQSTPLERQQTKWVVVGLAGLVAIPAVAAVVDAAIEGNPAPVVMLISWHMQVLAWLLLPTTLALSILRHRLWDIDRLIRRTLVYATLTAALAGLYLGSVLALQAAFRGLTQPGWTPLGGLEQAPAITVLSTLFIAALAGPLRARVQRWIDRRFYRQGYDAGQIVAAYGAAMRDEAQADLDQLNRQLLGVVQATLEPESVFLWLRR